MESIFERDFYPTPEDVIDQMLVMSDINNKVILEPSAGSGNIVEYLQQNGAQEVIACEKNSKLRSIVEKKCAVIADDFLTVTSDMVSHIDMIVMNPPFSCEETHILHAYEIAPQGCEIISLCNTSMLSTSFYSGTEKQRKIKELIELYGDDEYLGDVFSTAERKTNVSVSVIRLYKPKTDDNEFQDYFFDTEEDVPEVQADGLITYDFVRDCVNRYVAAVQMFDDIMDASKKINNLTSAIGASHICFGATLKNGDISTSITKDQFKKALQKNAWQWLFSKFKMEKYLTQKVRNDINSFVEKQRNIPFTMKNIYRMIEMIVGTHEDRMKHVLVEAFDLICSFSAENSTAGEKWKTNSDYKINKKFIVPYICDYDARWASPHVKTHWDYSKIEDVIKALCYLTGKNYDEQISLGDFCREFKIPWGTWSPMGHFKYFNDGRNPEYVEGFFKIKGHKKGTMHFEFLDENVWHKFNYEVAKIKGWQLPKERK